MAVMTNTMLWEQEAIKSKLHYFQTKSCVSLKNSFFCFIKFPPFQRICSPLERVDNPVDRFYFGLTFKAKY